MKIAVWHNLPSGGAKRALHMHVKGLHERGHTIRVYAPSSADRNYLPLTPFAASETILPLPSLRTQPRRQGIPAGFFSEEAEARIARLEQMEQHAQECARLIEADGNDILLANSCQFTYNSPIGIAKLPSVSYLQEPYRPFYEASPRLPWLLPTTSTAHPRNPFKRAMERSRDLHRLHSIRRQASAEWDWARRFDRILCNSQYSRESILRAYGIDSKVCYLGIDTQAFRPRVTNKEAFVVCVGSIHPSKRMDAAIRTIAAIPESTRPPLELIGNLADVPYQAYLQDLAKELGVSLHIRMMLSDSELQRTMSRAACFLYTSHLEPFGLTPLEANACGTAVVAIGEGGVRETIIPGINGHLSLNRDDAELAEYVQRFTLNLDHASAMGSQARQHVLRHWPVKDAVDRVERELQQIAN